nr:hypothetical protein CR513_53787 [Ipomoea batatas]
MKNGRKQNRRIEVNARHVTFLCDFQWISTRDRITDKGMKHGSRKSYPFLHVNSFCTFDLPIEALHRRPEGPMQHSCCKSSTRAASPPTSKWHIIESLALQTLQLVGLNQQILLGCVRQVSLGHKLCSVLPGLGVPVDCIKIHHKPRVLGDFVAIYDAILPALSENQWERWMQSQCSLVLLDGSEALQVPIAVPHLLYRFLPRKDPVFGIKFQEFELEIIKYQETEGVEWHTKKRPLIPFLVSFISALGSSAISSRISIMSFFSFFPSRISFSCCVMIPSINSSNLSSNALIFFPAPSRSYFFKGPKISPALTCPESSVIPFAISLISELSFSLVEHLVLIISLQTRLFVIAMNRIPTSQDSPFSAQSRKQSSSFIISSCLTSANLLICWGDRISTMQIFFKKIQYYCSPEWKTRPGCKADVMVFEDLFGYRAIRHDISVRMFMNAVSTLVASRADVSMKNRFSLSANSWASSTGTARRLPRSHLFPMSIMTMFLSAWLRSSSNHLAMWSNDWRFVMSYTSIAPTAPL